MACKGGISVKQGGVDIWLLVITTEAGLNIGSNYLKALGGDQKQVETGGELTHGMAPGEFPIFFVTGGRSQSLPYQGLRAGRENPVYKH